MNMAKSVHPDFEALISNPKNWSKFQDLLDTAACLVGDFENFGEVLQSNEDGLYDETTRIEKLRGIVLSLDPEMVPHGDYLPWLTEEQQKRLEEVAAEVIAWGDGENIRDIMYGKADAETMTPRERLEATGYPDADEDRKARLRKRLGFNPDPE